MKYFPLLGLLVYATAAWNCALADPGMPQTAPQASAQAAFRAGVAAFQDSDLERARHLLERARDGGMTSFALLYNLGVVYFRLGLYTEAETAFTRLLDSPHAPLSRYNLGLVLQAKGDTQGALHWFRQAAEDSSPLRIRALAQRQLANPSVDSPGTTDATRTVGFVSVATGYDDNISSTPDGSVTDEAGAFGDFLLSGRVDLDQGRGRAIRLDAVAYTRQYPGNGEFDNAYLAGGAAWQQPLPAAQLISGLTVSRLWSDGGLLEQQIRLSVTYDRPDCFWDQQFTTDCEVEGFASTIQGGSGFSEYDGELFGGGVTIEKYAGRWRFDSDYRFEVDRRADLETPEEFFSLSPIRHAFSVSAERKITDALSLGAEQRLWLSRYDDPHRLVESGQVKTRTREDQQFRTGLFASYQLDRRWQLGMELSWAERRSSLQRYEYTRTELVVSFDGVF